MVDIALRKRLILIVALAIMIVAGSFYGYWQKYSTPDVAVSSVPTGEKSGGNSKDGEDIVYVSGAVNKPGVFKLPAGSRVLDAVNIAGGFAPGADNAKINLAQQVNDGMHINVPGSISPNNAAGTGSPARSGDKININTADKAELDKLPGVGPAMAQRIVEYRQTNGLFKDTAEIKKVPGIGEAKFNQMKDKITI